MKIFSALVLSFAIIVYSVESSESRGNEWNPPSPEDDELFTAHEATRLLNELDPPQYLHDGNLGHNTSMPSTHAEHPNQDEKPETSQHKSSLNSSTKREPIDLNYPLIGSPPPIKRSRSRSPSGHHHPAWLRPHRPHPSDCASASRPARLSVTPTSLPSMNQYEYRLEDLEYIRLTPRKNNHRTFVFRKYSFPADTELRLMAISNRAYEPIPTNEHIVLSSFDGYVYAILESTNVLTGMYIPTIRDRKRVKIHMRSGAIFTLTDNEMQEVPLGRKNPIVKHFRITRVKSESL